MDDEAYLASVEAMLTAEGMAEAAELLREAVRRAEAVPNDMLNDVCKCLVAAQQRRSVFKSHRCTAHAPCVGT